MNRNVDHPHLHRHTRRPAQRPDEGTRTRGPAHDGANDGANDGRSDVAADDAALAGADGAPPDLVQQLLDDGGDEDAMEVARGTTWRVDEVELDNRFGQDHASVMADPWPTDPRWSPQDLYPQGGFDDAFGWDMRVGGASSLHEADPEAPYDLDENHTFFGEEFGAGAHNAGRSVEPQVRTQNRAPKGHVLTDSRIHEDVREAFAMLTDISEADLDAVEVSVKEGQVTLTGAVNDRLTRFRLERCAAESQGVKEVNNQLRVTQTPLTDAFHR